MVKYFVFWLVSDMSVFLTVLSRRNACLSKKRILPLKAFLLFIAGFMVNLSHANPLPADDVFKLNAIISDPNTLTLNFDVLANHYLYKDRFKIKLQNGHVGPIRFPQAVVFTDSSGKTYEAYQNNFTLNLPLLFDKKGKTSLDIQYQGCSAKGFCYPPQKQSFALFIDENLGLYRINPQKAAMAIKKSINPLKPQSLLNDKTLASPLSLLIALLSFYALGLLLAFTPCVLPMVPIISSLIVGHKNPSTLRAFLLSLCYVLAMSLTYAFIGLFIATLGQNFQLIFQKPIIIISFSLLFIALALSMFGYFDLKLPDKWLATLSKESQHFAGGAYLGAMIMGVLATLILSPCVSAPLVGVLSFIAQSGNVFLGASSLFIMSLGMGTPLLFIGIGAGVLLPKAGNWMNQVKTFFGVLMLGLAIYTLAKLLPAPYPFYLYGLLLIGYGLNLAPFWLKNAKPHLISQMLGLITLLYGAMLIIGGAMGNEDLLMPLKRQPCLAHEALKNKAKAIDSLNQLMTSVRQSQKPVLLSFSASWCASCQIMKKQVFTSPAVKEALKDFTYLQVDLSEITPSKKQIMDKFNVIAPPTFIFFKAGKELKDKRLIGETSQADFLQQLSIVE